MYPIQTSSEKSIAIRDIETGAEMRAVEALQKEVWGVPDLDVVPLSEIVAVKTAGGVLIGAFDGNDLVGFVYGFVSYEDGQMGHHSHMLAVRSAYRGFNIGHRLKLAQRERVLSQGITLMSWTFDPLQSLNAYLNFGKLGVISNRYFFDFYGDDAASFLHQNGTDRLWIKWLLASPRVSERLGRNAGSPEFENVRPLVEIDGSNSPHLHDLDKELSGRDVAIEIPANINALERDRREVAAEWRNTTREAFVAALRAGYIVTEFDRASRDGQRFGRYLLSRRNGVEL